MNIKSQQISYKLFVLVLVAFICVFSSNTIQAQQNQPLSEQQKIDSLLSIIGSTKNAQFYRNGSYYDCDKAAAHLRMKLRNAPVPTDNITAEQFIKYVASESSFSGKDYKVKFDNGTEITSREFLTEALEKMEKSL